MKHHAGAPDSLIPTRDRSKKSPGKVRGPASALSGAQFRLGGLVVESTRSSGTGGYARAAAVDEDLRFGALLADLSSALFNLSPGDVDTQVESALRRVAALLRTDRIAFGEFSADRGRVVLTHAYAAPDAPAHAGAILDERVPWWTEQVRRGALLRFARLPHELPLEAALEREVCLREGIKSHLTIPVEVEQAVRCALTLVSVRRFRKWPDQLVQRLKLLGTIVAGTLARKRAHEALRASEQSLRQSRESLSKLAARLIHAQEEERRRIAREMHDDWAQRLALLSIDITKVEKHIGAPELARPLLRAMQEHLVAFSEDVHDLSRQLHPSILDDLGLVEALRSECACFSRREGIAVVYRAERVPATLAKGASLCVYRIAQEALRNLAKHAAVKDAWVTLGTTGSELVLRVRDKGVGFDPAAERSQPGLGLASMAERVRLVHAKFAVTSAPGRGTTVEVRVPLERSHS